MVHVTSLVFVQTAETAHLSQSSLRTNRTPNVGGLRIQIHPFGKNCAFGLRIPRKQRSLGRMTDAGPAIKTLREAQGLSLRKLAALSGTNPGYLSQVEQGKKTPTRRWLRAVTEALGKNLGGNA